MTSLPDVPCGDFHRMSRVELAAIRYIGADNLALPPFGFPTPDVDKTLAARGVRRIRQCWPSPRAGT